jgi:predicted nucleotidyltransferase
MLAGYPCFVAATESDFDLIFAALGKRKVRYLIVGGVAVVLHGIPRFTADIDLVLALDKSNVLAALDALVGLGYRPRAPVPLLDFADPALRRDWIEEKGLTVFSLWSADHPATEIDLFIEEPFPFEEVFARATQVDLGSNQVTVASVADLIELKRRADRPKDREDIERLMALVEGRTRG